MENGALSDDAKDSLFGLRNDQRINQLFGESMMSE
jgi:hypothetical protein